jgi:hypothetical protein
MTTLTKGKLGAERKELGAVLGNGFSLSYVATNHVHRVPNSAKKPTKTKKSAFSIIQLH